MTERANVMVCEKIISDETGALTIEWVVLTAGVITLGIAVYGAFKIETDSSFAYSIVSAVTELLALVAQTKLNTMKFVMCNFKSANFASEPSTGDLTLVSKFRVWPLMFALSRQDQRGHRGDLLPLRPARAFHALRQPASRRR